MYDSALLQLLRRAAADSVLLLLQQQRQAVTRMGSELGLLLVCVRKHESTHTARVGP